MQNGGSKMVDPRWQIQDGRSKMVDPRWWIQDGRSKMAATNLKMAATNMFSLMKLSRFLAFRMNKICNKVEGDKSPRVIM